MSQQYIDSKFFKNINEPSIFTKTKHQLLNDILNSYDIVSPSKQSISSKNTSKSSTNKPQVSIIIPTLFPISRNDPIYMLTIRYKFIEVAKTLLGIPYGKKYLIAHPKYNKNIFLDCCGLVRHAFNLMKRDFGFTLGKWNQCYQYDILPKAIPFEKLQPGDLVFYTGIYYPDKYKKQQLHNIVHVEIYLGKGEMTIGSRDSYGVVEIYDTFQFESSTYYNIEYKFKSIDTWIKGIHKSFCSEHDWGRGNNIKKKKSITNMNNYNDIQIENNCLLKSKSYISDKVKFYSHKHNQSNISNNNSINNNNYCYQRMDTVSSKFSNVVDSYKKLKEKQKVKVVKLSKQEHKGNINYSNTKRNGVGTFLNYPKIERILFMNNNGNQIKGCETKIGTRNGNDNKKGFKYQCTERLLNEIVFNENKKRNSKKDTEGNTITKKNKIDNNNNKNHVEEEKCSYLSNKHNNKIKNKKTHETPKTENTNSFVFEEY